MKQQLCTILLILSCAILCRAQDFIIKKSGDTVYAKILDVTAAEIQYLKAGQSKGSPYILLKSAVKQISYSNGTEDSLMLPTAKPGTSKVLPGLSDPYKEGRLDARKYYTDYRTTGTSVLVSGLLSPLIGLIPAIACSATPPKNQNLGYPNPDLMKNEAYAYGYKQEARKIKKDSAWKNLTIALVVNLVFGFVTLANAHH